MLGSPQRLGANVVIVLPSEGESITMGADATNELVAHRRLKTIVGDKAMPTYVYACDTCRVEFEKFQSFKDEPLRTCPTCAGAVRRVLQPAGIVFKGSGWHITDYRAQSGGSSGGNGESAASTSTPAADGAASTSTPAADSTTNSAPATPPASSSTGSDSAAS